MKRKVLSVWLVAMLLAVVVALWPAENLRSTSPVRLGAVVDGWTQVHPRRLAATIDALEERNNLQQRGVLVDLGGQQMDPILRPRVRAVRRTARGPPSALVGDVRERGPRSERRKHAERTDDGEVAGDAARRHGHRMAGATTKP